MEGRGKARWILDPVEVVFFVPSAAAGSSTTDFDFTKAAPFEFASATTINTRGQAMTRIDLHEVPKEQCTK